jgi:hypothetical protein
MYTQAIQCYLSFTQFTVHRCTRTTILSFHYSSPSSGWRRTSCNSLRLWIFHVNLLFTEAVFSMPATHSKMVVNQLVVNSNLYSHEHYWYSTVVTVRTRLLILYWYSAGAALPSVSPISAGIWHAENAVLCIVARDVTEVTWSFLTVAPSSVTAQPSNARCGAKRGEGRGGKMRQRSATIAQSHSLRFQNFSSSRMGRLCDNI